MDIHYATAGCISFQFYTNFLVLFSSFFQIFISSRRVFFSSFFFSNCNINGFNSYDYLYTLREYIPLQWIMNVHFFPYKKFLLKISRKMVVSLLALLASCICIHVVCIHFIFFISFFNFLHTCNGFVAYFCIMLFFTILRFNYCCF